jgi:hypothetical protein
LAHRCVKYCVKYVVLTKYGDLQNTLGGRHIASNSDGEATALWPHARGMRLCSLSLYLPGFPDWPVSVEFGNPVRFCGHRNGGIMTRSDSFWPDSCSDADWCCGRPSHWGSRLGFHAARVYCASEFLDVTMLWLLNILREQRPGAARQPRREQALRDS